MGVGGYRWVCGFGELLVLYICICQGTSGESHSSLHMQGDVFNHYAFEKAVKMQSIYDDNI